MLGKRKRGKPSKSKKSESNFLSPCMNEEISNDETNETQLNQTANETKPKRKGRQKKSEVCQNDKDEIIINETEPRKGRSKKSTDVQCTRKGRPKKSPNGNLHEDSIIEVNSEEMHQIDSEKVEYKYRSLRKRSVTNGKVLNTELDIHVQEEPKKIGRLKKLVKEPNPEVETQENGKNEPDESDSTREEPKKKGRTKKLSVQKPNPEVETQENGKNEPDESESTREEPKKKGRTKKLSVKNPNPELKKQENVKNECDESEMQDAQEEPKNKDKPKKLSVKNLNPGVETQENVETFNESEVPEEPTKKGRPKKLSVKKPNLKTHENGNIKSDISEVCDTQEPIKRRTSKRHCVEESNPQVGTHENANSDEHEFKKIKTQSNESKEYNLPLESPKKRGRPRINEETNDEDAKRKRGRGRKSFNRYTDNYDDSLANYNERVDYSTKVSNKQKIVECDVCHESMMIVKYQKDHMAVHNYLCWLKGEAPMDLKNEIVTERILTRAKLYNRKAAFRCAVCNKTNKSARGYLSHVQFCGKTEEEKLSAMSPCEMCGKLLMPASIDSHIYHMHNPNKKPEPKIENLRQRKAAEKCLKSLSIGNSDGDKQLNLEIDSNDEFNEFYTVVKILKKDFMDEWTKAFLNDETVNCPCPKCDFKTERMTELKKHFKLCSAKSKKFQCLECEFLTANEKEVVSHIKTLHVLGVTISRQKKKRLEKNVETVSGLPYIPFVKYAEQVGKPKMNNNFFTKALSWTKEQNALHHSNEKLFPSLYFEMDEWKFKNDNEVKKYIQHTERSIRIKFKDEWFSLKRYETSIQDNFAAIFCGGPVFGLAWAPGTGRQFLAVGAHLSMSDFYQVSSTCAGPGNIQIWSFGNMGNKKNNQVNDAKLEYLICHDCRGAWSLDWCPSGCRDERMGLLAVATASGSVIIFSIPMPYNENPIFPACKPKPILSLEISPNERYHCTKVSWSKVKPHNTIAGGFANGYVALWDIDTESFLLKKGKTIYPYKIFQAHHSIISGLTFSPLNNEFIVTCSHDKMIKYWDLNDTTAPVSKNSRHLATDLSWLLHWMTCGYSIDNICSGSETTMCFNSIRDIVYELQTYVSGIKATATSISANDWLNGIALAHDNGQINLAFGKKQPKMNHDERKKYIKVIIEPNLYDFNNKKYLEKAATNDENYDLNDSIEYEDTVSKYGLHFKTNFCLGFNDTLKGNPANPINIYPVITANKVAWNPNISGFLNMAVGYQNGLVILPKILISPMDQHKVDELDN